jgi:hypothetical protein
MRSNVGIFFDTVFETSEFQIVASTYLRLVSNACVQLRD